MLKPLVRLLRLLDSERTDSQQAPDLGQMNGDECRQCVGHLLGKQLLPSAILSCPILVPAVKLTMHSAPVRRENEPCCPSGLVVEKLGKVHKAAQMEKIGLFSRLKVLNLVLSSLKTMRQSRRVVDCSPLRKSGVTSTLLFHLPEVTLACLIPATAGCSQEESYRLRSMRLKELFMRTTSLLCRCLDGNFAEMWLCSSDAPHVLIRDFFLVALVFVCLKSAARSSGL